MNGIGYLVNRDGVRTVFFPSTPENDAIIKEAEKNMGTAWSRSSSDQKVTLCCALALIIGILLMITCGGCWNGGSDDMPQHTCSITCPPI